MFPAEKHMFQVEKHLYKGEKYMSSVHEHKKLRMARTFVRPIENNYWTYREQLHDIRNSTSQREWD